MKRSLHIPLIIATLSIFLFYACNFGWGSKPDSARQNCQCIFPSMYQRDSSVVVEYDSSYFEKGHLKVGVNGEVVEGLQLTIDGMLGGQRKKIQGNQISSYRLQRMPDDMVSAYESLRRFYCPAYNNLCSDPSLTDSVFRAEVNILIREFKEEFQKRLAAIGEQKNNRLPVEVTKKMPHVSNVQQYQGMLTFDFLNPTSAQASLKAYLSPHPASPGIEAYPNPIVKPLPPRSRASVTIDLKKVDWEYAQRYPEGSVRVVLTFAPTGGREWAVDTLVYGGEEYVMN